MKKELTGGTVLIPDFLARPGILFSFKPTYSRPLLLHMRTGTQRKAVNGQGPVWTLVCGGKEAEVPAVAGLGSKPNSQGLGSSSSLSTLCP